MKYFLNKEKQCPLVLFMDKFNGNLKLRGLNLFKKYSCIIYDNPCL